ncbi:MAG: hypothetical protein HOK28_10240 [Deltaproteobacteria bacterium]|jgi:hypothetical protein|nr:hypothetical protein [Deltaproteobacteria bacterium]
MKLKDIRVLAFFMIIIGCGQSHRPATYPENNDAMGQDVPSNSENSDATDPTEPDEGVPHCEPTSADLSDSTDESDASNPGTGGDDDETDITDISDPSGDTDTPESDPTEPDETDTGDPFETPAPGTYSYERIALAGFDSALRVVFHPSGDYALILSRYDTIHIYDWQTQTTTTIPVGANHKMLLTDVVFSSDGNSAWITATDTQNGSTAMVLRFDHASYLARTEESDPAELVSTFSPTISGQSAKAIALPWDNSYPIVALQSGQSGNYIWTLRRFHPITGEFETLNTSTFASAPAEDMAIVNNEFGAWGVLVVGGSTNADTKYYTELGGQGEWRSNLGNIGNANRVEAYPGGEYALVVSWSGRSIYRFKHGEFAAYNDAPRFASQGIWDVSFQDDGRRALISGRASSNGSAGTALEYRHDLYSCPNTTSSCGAAAITDVSIGGFNDAPWQADSNTYLFDTAFRPGCDGGLLVGGYNNSSDTGFLGEFTIENARDCREN